jgi:hypothetical protein
VATEADLGEHKKVCAVRVTLCFATITSSPTRFDLIKILKINEIPARVIRGFD